MRNLFLCRCAFVASIFAFGSKAQAQDNKTTTGKIESYSTMHCIGIECSISGDANHDATCQVEYRKKADTAWRKALPLLRCETDRANSFAGSIFNLEPGATYEVRLQITDPDGGNQTSTLTQQTRPVPTLPANARTLHVVPGTGGGDGSVAAPFKGLKAAQAAAQPGDIFLLKAGNYGKFRFEKSGSAGKPICWKGSGEAVIERVELAGSNNWFEGLTFRYDGKSTNEVGGRDLEKDGFTGEKCRENIVLGNQFLGFHRAIVLGRGTVDWYIADNVIVGDNDPINGGLSGEGVELNKSRGCIVAHNKISRVADGVSYPSVNCDIYGNEIFDVSDDGVETDMGQANVRVWGNRITNVANNVFSWQPMNRGPWYFIRNQVVLTQGKIYKFSTVPDRFAVLHNTFVFPKTASEYAQRLLNSYCRNNIYIAYGTESPMLRAAWNKKKPNTPGGSFTPNWMSDVDYDGFDWGSMPDPIVWNGKPYNDLKTFAAEVGIEKHGIRVRREEIFETWLTPTKGKTTIGHLSLKSGSNAVDAGALLPNINDDFVGKGPDLGALELGKPLPAYGPRPGTPFAK